MSLTCEVITGNSKLEELRPAIEALYFRAERPNPYMCPGWIFSWLKTLGKSETTVCLALRDGETLRAFWPFFECHSLTGKGLWPLGAHCADLFDPLMDSPGQELPDELLNGLEFLLKSYDFIWLPLLDRLRAVGDIGPRLKIRGLKHLVRPRTENQKIHLPETGFEAFHKEHMGSKSRQNLRRKLRRLEEQGTVSFGVLTEPKAVEDFLPIMIAIERKSWKGQQRLGIFSKKSIKEFYKEAIPAMAKDGELRIDTLSLGERVIAYEFSLVRDGYRCVHNQAYLPEFKEWSPGTLLLLHTLEWAFDKGLSIVDFMQGKHDYKLRLATDSSLLYDVNLFARNRNGLLNYLAVKLFSRRVKNSYKSSDLEDV